MGGSTFKTLSVARRALTSQDNVTADLAKLAVVSDKGMSMVNNE
jgi:hypothetical protein